ncbi:alpha/beta hydrolase [Sphingomonas sp. RRHST34]|uniref:Alpha/beta hydrolase n=2 Tax=Sphingomonas citri TaxID=2862499 RepID=A0ABS7BSE0_9SPHN|nr:alpha/beta hydrolase [Sphingomonas citri]
MLIPTRVRPSELDRLIAAVDPDLRAPLRGRVDLGGTPLSRATLAAARNSIITPRPLPAPPIAARRIAGVPGAPPVSLYVINQGEPGTRRPAILHIHGGGYVLMRADDTFPQLQTIARAHDCVIVTVDYRLAPETRFPGARDDNEAALRWLHREADSLGVDRSRIAVMGESAGGGHAAMLALAARDRGEVSLVAQILVYPMLDDRTGSRRMPRTGIGEIGWTSAQNRFGWGALLGVAAGSSVVPSGAVPARVPDLAGLPPTFIAVGSIDLFVDEDIDYAHRLIDAGVSTDLMVLDGAYHGFDGAVPDAPVTRRFVASRDAALRRAFTPGGWRRG